MSLPRTAATDAMWRAFKEARGVAGERHDVVRFGDGPAMADELLALCLAGTKRATASLLREYGPEAPVPQVGDHVVVLDGRGEPRCIWRTIRVDVAPLCAVDEAFARDEGEGDRTRASWLELHNRYFADQAAREGFAMHEELETVFERFVLVWPPEAADE